MSWMLFAWLSQPVLAWDSASTSASVQIPQGAGALTIQGIDGFGRHSHGGAAARLGAARFQATWSGSEPLPLTVSRVVFLSGHDCIEPPTDARSEPVFGGMVLGDAPASRVSVNVPAGTSELSVGFSAVEAYYSWCDRFAFSVTFDAGGTPVTAIAETNIVRVEAFRDPVIDEVGSPSPP